MVVIMATVRPEDAGAVGGTMQTLRQTGVIPVLAVPVTIAGSASRGHPAAAITSGTTAAMHCGRHLRADRTGLAHLQAHTHQLGVSACLRRKTMLGSCVGRAT